MTEWIPVMRSEEAARRQVAFVEVARHEIALWRDDAGVVNAWENHCPHRGVRLSIGTNAGTELVCRYHGWRFATGTAACRFIPSHPAQVPPKAARVAAYHACERYGLVWVHLGSPSDEPRISESWNCPVATLRSVTIRAPLADVAQAFSREMPESEPQRFSLEVHASESALLLLQPQCDESTVVHGILRQAGAAPMIDRLRCYNQRLKGLRERIESGLCPTSA